MYDGLIHYVGLFVIYDLQTSKVGYISRDMYSDAVPLNTPENIRNLVHVCNQDKPDHINYIDMYGIIVDEVTELWEDE